MKCGDRVKLSQSYINGQRILHEYLKNDPSHQCVLKPESLTREGTVHKLTWDDEVLVKWDDCRVVNPQRHQYAQMDLTVTVSAPSSALQRRSRKPCRDYHIR